MTVLPLLPGLAGLADDYDGFIVDLWGVLHDGVAAFPDAVACLRELKSRDKRVVILSNAPRRAREVAARNAELGIAPELADAVLSSGEAAWRDLKARADPWYRTLGRHCYHLGPERDRGMRDGLDYTFVADLEAADFILLTGALGTEDEAGDYTELLRRAKALGLAMICANPDLEVIRGGRREICAGSIAARYEELGGRVRYHGKPHPPIYRACLELIGIGDPGRILAIGDSLRTDVAGAERAGMATLFVLDGIHGQALGLGQGRPVDPERLAAFCAAAGIRPTAAMPSLRW